MPNFCCYRPIADFTCPAVQRSGQIIFFILSRRDHPFLLFAQLPVRTDLGMKMDIHFIFIKTGCSVLHSSSALWIAAIFSSLYGSRIRRVGVALRHTSPADGNQRRTVPVCNWQPVISLIFIASSSVLQRER